MHNGIMPDRNVIADDGFCPFKGAMDNGAILDIHFVADAYAIYISAHNCVEPNTAIIAHNDITYYSCIGRDETVSSKLRVNIFYM
jgi:hypothetical protein